MSFSKTPKSLRVLIKLATFSSFCWRAKSKLSLLVETVAESLAMLGVTCDLPAAETEIVSDLFVCQGFKIKVAKTIVRITKAQTISAIAIVLPLENPFSILVFYQN